MDRQSLVRWIEGYERAWRTPTGPGLDAALAGLFAPGATYLPAPVERPYQGIPAIASMWSAARLGPDEDFTMAAEVVAVDEQARAGVARVEVRYGPPKHLRYRDLWILRFDAEGRCVAFEEWPFWPPGTEGTYQQGPDIAGWSAEARP